MRPFPRSAELQQLRERIVATERELGATRHELMRYAQANRALEAIRAAFEEKLGHVTKERDVYKTNVEDMQLRINALVSDGADLFLAGKKAADLHWRDVVDGLLDQLNEKKGAV